MFFTLSVLFSLQMRMFLSICFATLSSIYFARACEHQFDITSFAVGFDMIFAYFSRACFASNISSPQEHIEHEVHLDRRRRISTRCVPAGTTPKRLAEESHSSNFSLWINTISSIFLRGREGASPNSITDLS